MKKNIMSIFIYGLLLSSIIFTIFVVCKEVTENPIESIYIKEKAVIKNKQYTVIKRPVYRLEIVTKEYNRKIIYEVPKYEYDYYEENQEIYISYRHELYKNGGVNNRNINIWDTEWEDKDE